MVKYIISIITIIILGVSSVFSQDKFVREWNVGLGSGINFSTLSMVHNNSNKDVDTKNTTRLNYGVAVRYITEKNLGLIAELNYSQQGWEEKFDDDTSKKDIHRLNYLELPILTHIYFGNKTRFFVNLGPKFSCLLSEKEEVEGLPLNGSTDESTGKILDNQYGKKVENKFDYGIMAGLGAEFRTKMGNFSLEGRYTLGLGDIYKSRKNDAFSRSANRVASIRLTYYTKLF